MWKKQWELFAPNFKDGKAHIDLKPYGGSQELRLLPGGGFGDFSHPTTRLALKMISSTVKGTTVIDIGCGSGILSLAAKLLGATAVYGIDIDPIAVEHSLNNLKINQQKVYFSTALPKIGFQEPLLIVMNMIPAEQKIAWESQKELHSLPKRLITSGILTETKPSYLDWAQAQGWHYLSELHEDGWSAFEFLNE